MGDRFIRDAECARRSGLSRTTRWRQEREGRFPLRRQIGRNSVAWLESEIDDWIAARAEGCPFAAIEHRCGDGERCDDAEPGMDGRAVGASLPTDSSA